jgi:hypothetical protein
MSAKSICNTYLLCCYYNVTVHCVYFSVYIFALLLSPDFFLNGLQGDGLNKHVFYMLHDYYLLDFILCCIYVDFRWSNHKCEIEVSL